MSGSHITQAVAKMNDTYFSRTPYNAPSWRQFVMCQELGHTFGLDHQNENFSDPNLGTCMDYTNDPDGPPSNEHPDAHDYEQLALIYAHTDSSTTVGQALPKGNGALLQDLEHPSEWGKVIRTSANGKPSLFEQDLGNGKKVFTFVIWADR